MVPAPRVPPHHTPSLAPHTGHRFLSRPIQLSSPRRDREAARCGAAGRLLASSFLPRYMLLVGVSLLLTYFPVLSLGVNQELARSRHAPGCKSPCLPPPPPRPDIYASPTRHLGIAAASATSRIRTPTPPTGRQGFPGRVCVYVGGRNAVEAAEQVGASSGRYRGSPRLRH